VHNAFPDRLIFEGLAHGNGLSELRRAAVRAFEGLSKLIDFGFDHDVRASCSEPFRAKNAIFSIHNRVDDMSTQQDKTMPLKFRCQSAADRRNRHPISADGRHGQDGLKRLITIRFQDADEAILKAKTQLSAVDSGIGGGPNPGQRGAPSRDHHRRRVPQSPPGRGDAVQHDS
jgi:hypothetical protein